MTETPKRMLTDEERWGASFAAAKVALQTSLTEAWIDLWEAVRSAIEETFVRSWFLLTLAGIGGIFIWVWFIAECVQLATRWGWLP